MLQVMDLARENAALRFELERLREEAKRLRLLVADEYTDPDGAAPRFRQVTLAGMEA
jgi:hypothetical protein